MNICDVRTRWINVDKDTVRSQQMDTLLKGYNFTNHERVFCRHWY